MAGDLLEVEANPTFNIRFVGDGGGREAKFIGIYSDGSTEESVRFVKIAS